MERNHSILHESGECVSKLTTDILCFRFGHNRLNTAVNRRGETVSVFWLNAATVHARHTIQVERNTENTFDKHSRKLTLNQDDTVMQFLHLAEASDPRRVSSSRLKATVRCPSRVYGWPYVSSGNVFTDQSRGGQHTRRRTLSAFHSGELRNDTSQPPGNDRHGWVKITECTWSCDRPRA